MSRNEFEQRKRGILGVLYGHSTAGLKSNSELKFDRSLKGKVDDEFQIFCEMINHHPDYVTTSCCSGRITIYRSGVTNRKINGALLFVSHEPVDESLFCHVEKCLHDGVPYYAAASTCMITPSGEQNAENAKENLPEAEITLKMEPFVIHIECASLLAARRLLQTASSLGFKNSGANTVGPKRVIVALRGSHRVEVPLRRATGADQDPNSGLLVPSSILPGLLHFCNEKMKMNSENIEHLRENVWEAIKGSSASSESSAVDMKAPICCSCADTCQEDTHNLLDQKTKRCTPFEKVEGALLQLMKNNILSNNEVKALLLDVPTKKFEKLGDAIIFNSLPHEWENILSLDYPQEKSILIFKAIADALKVRVLGTHGRIEGTTRIPGIRLLPVGHELPSPWVVHKENGCAYSIEISRLMFASGNGTERSRMPASIQQGEEIVDLFSGLGYFTMPMILTKKAKRITACDINPLAHKALKQGILANKRASGVHLTVNGEFMGIVGTNGALSHGQGKQQKDQEGVNNTIVEMWLGDSSRAGTPEGAGGDSLFGRADRILLGLIPSSQLSWMSALRVINQSRGGIVHVHENAGSVQEVREMVLNGFLKLCKESGREAWSLDILHVERVKSYAPLVFHFVVDLKITPPELC